MLKTIGTTFSAAFLCTTLAVVSAIASPTVKDFSGNADYYANCYHGKKTASGALHDKTKFMAAHRTLPFGTKVRITHRKTKKQCVVVINDRGPFTADRVIDVSYAAAQELGIVSGSKMVDCEVIAED
ncbi:MAG: septal ring lytic transglycosylase RlpA family protein [Candidatus Obscuribacterales bacterium]|nr:septal ring lytic transglycosylase RlpA family protein [Cyanobacteria bacterium SZAS LIN-5]RTL38751.1 MAG: septal ring lytic transglycosylase RlpA family protein [Candidatus Melainabacteria bacterium]